jgi:cytosine deaminase
MSFDLIFKNARIGGSNQPAADIGVAKGLIGCVNHNLTGDCPIVHLDGRLVLPGLIETHIHLDKSCLLDRCDCGGGSLAEAVAAVAAAKQDFTEEDVYARASRTLEKAILQGTMRMRTHVEVDPRIGLTSLYALKCLKHDYAWAIDLTICAFPQEGLLDDTGCEDVLIGAMEAGADLVGGAPYMDRDTHGHIAKIFEIARRFDVDIDLHLDFSLDPGQLDIVEVCRKTDEMGWGGRVTVGHVTKLSTLPPEQFERIGALLAETGVALTVLPSTDLFLMGRDHRQNVPRGVAPAHRLLSQGVTCSISTNNVLNPFTPFGDCSLIRMANLYANVAQIGSPEGIESCLDMVTTQSARLMRLDNYGIAPGKLADLLIFDCTSGAQAVAEIATPLAGYKRGRKTFVRPVPQLLR